MQSSECSASVSIAVEKVVKTSKEEFTKQKEQRERLKTWREIIVSCVAKNGLLIIIAKNLFVSVSDIIVRSLPDIDPLTLILLRSLLSLSLLLPLWWVVTWSAFFHLFSISLYFNLTFFFNLYGITLNF